MNPAYLDIQAIQESAVTQVAALAVTLDRESADFLAIAVIPVFPVTAVLALAATAACLAIAAFQVTQDRAFPAIAAQADIPVAESQATAEVAFQALADIPGDPATAGCRARQV